MTPVKSYAYRVAALIAGLSCCASSPSFALELIFDYRFDESGFFDREAPRRALEAAADRYEAHLDGALASLTNEEWTAEVAQPATGDLITVESLDVPEDSLRIFVAARSLSREARLAVGGPGGWRFRCDPSASITLCQGFDASQPGLSFLLGALGGIFEISLDRIVFRGRMSAREFPATGFAPWGGSISFDREAPWHFDVASEVPADRIDFLSIAIHELGHVLGIGTAESWGTLTPADSFIGPRAVAVHDGPVPLADDLAHWPDGTQSHLRDVPATAAFTRRIMLGERRDLTELDLGALIDIGWTRRPPEGTTALTPYYLRPLRGDLDGDGAVDQRDLEALVEHLAAPSADDVIAADIHPLDAELHPAGDGLLDGHDLAALRRAANLAADAEDGALEASLAEVLLMIHAGPLWRELPGIEETVALYLRDDVAAARLLGWKAHPLEWPPEIVPNATPLAGDLDGDGRISHADVAGLERYFAPRLSALAQEAADVAPMQDGNSIGDGKLDEGDVEILRRAVVETDVDGDGLPTRVENETNRLWIALVGRPRHQPLVRWSDECLDFEEPVSPRAVPHFTLDASVRGPETATEDLTLAFCRRDGSAWSEAPAISPEEAERLIKELRDRSKERLPDDEGDFDVRRMDDAEQRPPIAERQPGPVSPPANVGGSGARGEASPPSRSNPPGVAPLAFEARRPARVPEVQGPKRIGAVPPSGQITPPQPDAEGMRRSQDAAPTSTQHPVRAAAAASAQRRVRRPPAAQTKAVHTPGERQARSEDITPSPTTAPPRVSSAAGPSWLRWLAELGAWVGAALELAWRSLVRWFAGTT